MKKKELSLRLYVAGNAPNSLQAIANAKAICQAHFAGTHLLEIVDLLARPERGLADGIIVTPTLVRLSPPPKRKVIGNLSETEQVVSALVAR